MPPLTFNRSDKNISIHAAHEGQRQSSGGGSTWGELFQSTLPTKGSDGRAAGTEQRYQHFNPRCPRRAATFINICAIGGPQISIHAAHEGQRHSFGNLIAPFSRFQSTLPTKGSDRRKLLPHKTRSNFNPRCPRRAATNHKVNADAIKIEFQSTLPTKGSDSPLVESRRHRNYDFNPRCPRRAATRKSAACG